MAGYQGWFNILAGKMYRRQHINRFFTDKKTVSPPAVNALLITYYLPAIV